MDKEKIEENTENAQAEDIVDGPFSLCLRKNKKESSDNFYQKSNNDEFYTMEKKGYLLIFAHKSFEFGGLDERPKVEEDVKKLSESFQRLNFIVQVELDRKVNEIQKIIETESDKDFQDYACLAVAISSHGNATAIAAKDGIYDINDITEPFKTTKSLVGKPKMFFIGCCRGKLVDRGVSLLDYRIETDGCREEVKIPVEADVLTVYATVEDYIAYHNELIGTQFFHYLTKALDNFAATKDMLTILTMANLDLAVSFSSQSEDADFNEKKQCMCFMSTLTKLVRFRLKDHKKFKTTKLFNNFNFLCTRP